MPVLLIEGYCDWKGTSAYNKSLGERRANSVKEYLVELGSDPRRIDTLSIGDEHAIPEAMSDQASLDRRAEFVIAKEINLQPSPEKIPQRHRSPWS